MTLLTPLLETWTPERKNERKKRPGGRRGPSTAIAFVQFSMGRSCPQEKRPNDDQTAPLMAPSNSCIGCYRGDVNTGFAAEGKPEFIVVVLQKAAGIPPEEARATFNVYAEQELGCAPGEVPAGRVSLAFRLCRDCAEQHGCQVGVLRSQIPSYRQNTP